jgi:hypothetical protein
MKSPVPAETAFFRFTGMASMMASRTLKNDKRIKNSPSKNTAVRATCQE